jgi:hypothetical protein
MIGIQLFSIFLSGHVLRPGHLSWYKRLATTASPLARSYSKSISASSWSECIVSTTCNHHTFNTQPLYTSPIEIWKFSKIASVEVEVDLRPTVSRPVCPGVRDLWSIFLSAWNFLQTVAAYWYHDFLNVVIDGKRLRELRNSVHHASGLDILISWPMLMETIFIICIRGTHCWRDAAYLYKAYLALNVLHQTTLFIFESSCRHNLHVTRSR